MNKKEMIGSVFGRLTVLGVSEKMTGGHKLMECLCSTWQGV